MEAAALSRTGSNSSVNTGICDQARYCLSAVHGEVTEAPVFRSGRCYFYLSLTHSALTGHLNNNDKIQNTASSLFPLWLCRHCCPQGNNQRRVQEVHSSGQQESEWQCQQLHSLQSPWCWLCVSWRSPAQGLGQLPGQPGTELCSGALPCAEPALGAHTLPQLILAALATDSSWLKCLTECQELLEALQAASASSGPASWFPPAPDTRAGCCSSSAQFWLHQGWMLSTDILCLCQGYRIHSYCRWCLLP